MDTQEKDHNRSERNSENREREATENEETLDDDELEAVVGGWSEWDTAQQSNQADWVW